MGPRERINAATFEPLEREPLKLFDVGARGGIDERWDGLERYLEVVGFEPDPEECDRLNEAAGSRQRYLPFALGSARQTVPFHVAAWPVASSIYPPDPDFLANFAGGDLLRNVETREIETTTLDEVCEQQGTWPDLLKIDVEGAELDVLRGGTEAVRRATALDVELAFAPLRPEAPGFPEVNEYLAVRGFTLAGLRRVFWRHRSGHPVLVQADGLYLSERVTGLKAELILVAYAPEAQDAWEDSGFF
jgi:FkbM family methyltransferase